MSDLLLISMIIAVLILAGTALVLLLLRRKLMRASDDEEFQTVFSAGFGVLKAFSLFTFVAFFTIALWFIIFTLPPDFPIPPGILFFTVLLIPVILYALFVERRRRTRTPNTRACYAVFRL